MALLAVASAIEIDRDAAREAAVRELADPRYAADDPSLLQRIVRRAFEELSDLLDSAASVVPGGVWGLVLGFVLVGLLIAIVATAGRRVLAERRSAAVGGQLFDDRGPTTAAEHRTLADQAQRDGRWDDAVRSRLRSLVRDLEERGLLANRPGRTADEAAREAGAVAPDQAGALVNASVLFDAVTFGDAHAREADALALEALAARMAIARVPAPIGGPR